MSQQDSTEVHNVTDALPTMEPETRKNVKKWGAVGLFAFGGLLLADDAVKRFRNRKDVKLTVVDKPDTPQD